MADNTQRFTIDGQQALAMLRNMAKEAGNYDTHIEAADKASERLTRTITPIQT